ncbi:MAG: hypothetical protein ACPGVG_20180, partial [Mycobacterium sp.]
PSGLIGDRWRHSLAAWHKKPSLVLDEEHTRDGETYGTFWRGCFPPLDGRNFRPRCREVAEEELTYQLRRGRGWQDEVDARKALLDRVHAKLREQARRCHGQYEADRHHGRIGLTSSDLVRDEARLGATSDLIKSQREKAAVVEEEHDPNLVRELLFGADPSPNVRRVNGSNGEAPAAEVTRFKRGPRSEHRLDGGMSGGGESLRTRHDEPKQRMQ